ncbi:hypothetical protein [Alishewanella tabrizica]|uniref:Double Cache domain-containing protein n=1 Tax=Alishewanella tabrizica TaxID=671278 RepID=A0ABQ2WGZ9_9ALTE|nr:hypothetical protein [Alishewanella tabrizica]GGW55875.1 hypothetical protein GCM10008111_10060 [Alishewanella tabrizica]
MQNPAIFEYHRTRNLAAILILLLSVSAALIHFLLTIDNRLIDTEQRLQAKALQLDNQLLPLVNFNAWITQSASLGISAQGSLLPMRLFSHAGDSLVFEDWQQKSPQIQLELNWLQHLAQAFTTLHIIQPGIEQVIYVSEQDFLFISPKPTEDFAIAELAPWFVKRNLADWQDDLLLQSTLLSHNNVVLSRRIKRGSEKVGYILFVLDVAALLKPLQQQSPEADFLLLDESGQQLGGTGQAGVIPDKLLLQVQRIGQHPFSLVMLAQREGVLQAGGRDFLTYWLGYLSVLTVFLVLCLYRLKQKIVAPVKRLTIHVERMLREQGGVRHIPSGWEEIFDKISRLKS